MKVRTITIQLIYSLKSGKSLLLAEIPSSSLKHPDFQDIICGWYQHNIFSCHLRQVRHYLDILCGSEEAVDTSIGILNAGLEASEKKGPTLSSVKGTLAD